MKRTFRAFTAVLATVWLAPLSALEPLASRIAHTDPTKFRSSSSVHGGAGTLDYMPLFDFHTTVSMNGIELQDREFFAAIKGGRKPNASIAQCLPAMAALDRLEQCLNQTR